MAGAMRDIPSGAQVGVRVLAVDAGNNVSTAYSYTLAVDTIAPVAPVIGMVAGNDIVNGTEKAAGVTVSGTAEAGATVAVTWGTVTHSAVAGANGAWSVRFESGEVPPDNPSSTITAIATDAAGNVGPSASRVVVVDSTSVVVIASVTADDIVNSAERAAGVVISGSAKPGASVVLSWGTLSRVINVDPAGTGDWTTTVATADVPADGSTTITATATDSAGNVGVYSRTVLIDTAAPTPPTIASIPEAAGGLNQAEVADGTVVNVNLAGSTAVAGDTLIVHWGTQNVTRVIAPGEAGTVIAVTIPNSVIANQGNGNVSVTASVNDAQGNIGGNSAATVVSVDTVVPTLTITDNVSSGTATGPVTFTFTFSEAVTGFTASDIVVTGGTPGALTGSSASYSMVVTPAASSAGTITVSVAAGVAADAAGNGNTAATPATQAFNTFAPPSLTITDDVAAATANSPVTFTFTFTEPVTGFTASDIVVAGGTPGPLSGSGAVYTMVVTPAAGSTGTITMNVAAGVATGTASGLGNTAATPASQPFDTQAPTLTITDDVSGTANGPVTYTFTWSEAVTGFAIGDITTSGMGSGTFGSFSGSGTTYTAVFTPAAGQSGTANVSVGPGVVTDAAGNANTGTVSASAQPYVPADTTPPTLTITDDVSGTANGPVTYTFTWSEAVTGFAIGDITTSGLGSGTFGSFSGSGTTYTAVFTPAAGQSGTANVSVGPGVVTDAAGNANTGTVSASAQPYDTAPPASVTSITLNPSSDSAPTGDNQTTDTTPTLTLTLNALLGSDTMRVFLDGSSTPLAGTLSGSGTTLDFTPTAPIAAGSHSFSASAIDVAGNLSPLLPSPYTLLIL
ncbi:MAG TPA: Ig-like domain-containing protein [Burkholderiaceae bacterium]|nr:Ig-like domain-containing protein [Burkholderiaceae bacterium]